MLGHGNGCLGISDQLRPISFAKADYQATRLGRVLAKMVMPTCLDGYTVFLSNITSPDGYWKPVSWEGFSEAYKCSEDKRAFTPGEALLSFELQARLYEFLFAWCESILA